MGCEQSRMNQPPLGPLKVDHVITIHPNQNTIKSKDIDSSSGGGGGVDKHKQSNGIENGTRPKQFLTPNKSSVPHHNQGEKEGVHHHVQMDPRDLEDALSEYKECEDSIHALEKEDPLTLFYIKKSHLQNVNEALEGTRDKIRSLELALQNGQELESSSRSNMSRRTPGSKDQSPLKKAKSLRRVVIEYGGKGDGVSKAEQEFLTSVNRLEIAGTELEMLQQDKVLVESEVATFKSICTKLIALYNRQDDISKKLSVGIAGAEEAKLYAQLADVETTKIRICEAYQRWREARSQIIDACAQFGAALKKWREIQDDTPSKLYDVTEEVRDDLVTSLQCITNARFYIRFDLPYCSKAEMTVLEKALSFIFIDVNSGERRLHADSCYKAFHNRAVALFAWTEMTVKQVIEPEVGRVRKELSKVSKQVRDVRFRSIQKQFPGVSWKVREEDWTSEQSSESGTSLTDPESVETYQNLDKGQLAQPPTVDEIYGKSSTTGTNYKTLFYSDNLSPKTQSLLGGVLGGGGGQGHDRGHRVENGGILSNHSK